MGNLLSRSTSNRSEGKKSKWKKNKRKNKRNMETSTDSDHYLALNNNEHENSNGNLINSYEEYNKRIDQQQQQMSNLNDLPDVPSAYANNYQAAQHDLINQSWSSPHEANNQFYQVNSHSMTMPSSIPYDPNQYTHSQIANTFLNQSQQGILEERSSKKVQFARPLQQPSPSKAPLNGTQSWHEPSATTNDVSLPSTRQESIPNRQSLHRTAMSTASSQAFQQKPIYVGIDHKATLAERGQTKANKRQHKSEKNNSDGFDPTITNQRTRSHTHHQHKNHELNDIPTSKNTVQSNRSIDPLQTNLSGAQRILTTTSTSTTTPNRSEQAIIHDIDVKIPKTRGIRHPQAQHVDQHSPVNNHEIKSSKSKTAHPHRREQHHPQQHGAVNRTNSPLRSEPTRRTENKHQGSPPTMRIPSSQQQQQQHRQKHSTVTNPTNNNRTRV